MKTSHVEITEWTFDGEEIGWKFYQVRLYGHHQDNYVSAFLIHRRTSSNKGKLGSLAGKGFYDLIGPHIEEIYKFCGVDELEVEVLANHWRLLQRRLRNKVSMELVELKTSKEKREFSVVRMLLKE